MFGKIGACLALAFCVALLVFVLPLLNSAFPTQAQSPATATPTPLPRLVNPTTTLDCGLPVHGYWNPEFYTDNTSLSKPHTWTLTADCTLPKIADTSAWLHFTNSSGNTVADGTWIIDGDGHTIYGPDAETTFIYVEGRAKVVLQDVTIRNADYDHRCSQYSNGWWWCDALIYLTKSELDASNVKIINGLGGVPFELINGSKATFTNLSATFNTFNSTYNGYAGVVSARGANTEVTINGAEVCGNQARHIVSATGGATANMRGTWKVRESNTYIDARGNKDPDDDVTRDTSLTYKASGGTINNGITRTWCTADGKEPFDWETYYVEQEAYVEMGNCFAKLGAIGWVCRPWVEPQISYITVWQIDSESQGHFRLKVMNPAVWQTDEERMLASSSDGRVAVYVVGPHCTKRDENGFPWLTDAACVDWQLRKARAGETEPLGEERFIAIAKGPNNPLENKTHVVYLDNAMSGRVIGTVDVWIGEPGVKSMAGTGAGLPAFFSPKPVTVPFVAAQALSEDGSQRHIVRAGDTLHSIAVAYNSSPWTLAEANQLADGGRWLTIGQALLIRDAEQVAAAAIEARRLAHVVKTGESLNTIAVRYRTTALEIARLNGLANGGRVIFPGQELVIRDEA